MDKSNLPPEFQAEELALTGDSALEALLIELQKAEQAVRINMAPYEQQIREIRSRMGQINTEQRKRERVSKQTSRSQVRQRAASGELPSFLQVLESQPVENDLAFENVKAFLKTGGEINFGYATKPGTVTFTDGKLQKNAQTILQAQELYASGWNPGATTLPGIRVHLSGTRVEKVIMPEEIIIELP